MHSLNHEHTAIETGVFPQEMTLASAKRSQLLSNEEYISLLKDSLADIAGRHLESKDPLAASQVEVLNGMPTNFEVPKRKGVIAEFYVSNPGAFNDLLTSLDDTSNRFAAANVDMSGALVYVRVIKEGNLLYPDVHYTNAARDIGRHIANTFVREVPYLGDLEEIDRRKEQEIRAKQYLKIGATIGAVGAVAAVAVSLIASHSASEARHIDQSLAELSSYSLTLKNVNQVSTILSDGTLQQKREALKIITTWSGPALANPTYLGKTDNTYSGPLFFSRIADRALENERDPSLRKDLENFKLTVSAKGNPVIMKQFDDYARIAATQNGMSPMQAKAMAWEHIVIPTKILTSGSVSKTEQLKISNQLGMVMYSSSKAIPALKYDYQRSIAPQLMNIKDPLVKETVNQWVEKL